MKWFVLALSLIAFTGAGLDITRGESTLSHRQTKRTITRDADSREFYGFVAIKAFSGFCLIGLFRFMNKDEDTWY